MTAFAAALLSNVTEAFKSLVDAEQLKIIHDTVLDFIKWSLGTVEPQTDGDKEAITLLKGVMTTYIPVYMGHQMLFWSGRYWEQTSPVFSGRVKSQDLVNPELENGCKELFVSCPKMF